MKPKKETGSRCQTKLGIYQYSDAPELFKVQCLLEEDHRGKHKWHIWTVEKPSKLEGLKMIR